MSSLGVKLAARPAGTVGWSRQTEPEPGEADMSRDASD